MTNPDPIADARAAHRNVLHYGQQAEPLGWDGNLAWMAKVEAAADRLALAALDEAYGLAHGMGGSQADWDALRASLEASHAD